jgi:hypothetical protein
MRPKELNCPNELAHNDRLVGANFVTFTYPLRYLTGYPWRKTKYIGLYVITPPSDSSIPIFFHHWIKLLSQEIKHLSGSVVFL